MAILVDVQFAVAVFLIPNILSNAVQVYRYRRNLPDRRFAYTFAGAGIVGAGIGTIALAEFSSTVLTTSVALVVLMYVAFRLTNPTWSLSWSAAQKSVGAIGGVGGFFQGAIGLSGPISVTYMNAVGLPRPEFIVTMSLYFLSMTAIQLPFQLAFGIMTPERIGYGLLALAPLVLGMGIGDALGRTISKLTFDRIIFVVLTLLACRLLWQNFV